MTQDQSETMRHKAVAIMGKGHNCAQAVVGAFAERYGMDAESALRVAACLGGGMKCASVCGAVSGALLVAGLRFGSADSDNKAAKKAADDATRAFLQRFTTLHGVITCRELLGCDISTEEGFKTASDAKLFATRCPEFVGDAAQILEEQGY